jgi:hypothetical protein
MLSKTKICGKSLTVDDLDGFVSRCMVKDHQNKRENFFLVSSNLKHRFELKMIYLEKLVIFSFRVQ